MWQSTKASGARRLREISPRKKSTSIEINKHWIERIQSGERWKSRGTGERLASRPKNANPVLACISWFPVDNRILDPEKAATSSRPNGKIVYVKDCVEHQHYRYSGKDYRCYANLRLSVSAEYDRAHERDRPHQKRNQVARHRNKWTTRNRASRCRVEHSSEQASEIEKRKRTRNPITPIRIKLMVGNIHEKFCTVGRLNQTAFI